MSQSIQPETLPQKAAGEIIQIIQSHNFTPGSKLPNEHDLSNLLHVSRNTIREAIKLLVSRNILEVRRGAGTFVSSKLGLSDDPLGLSMISSSKQLISEVYQLSLILEPRTAALAAQNADENLIRALSASLTELEQILSQPHSESTASTDIRLSQNEVNFHIKIAECSQNTIICNIISAIYSACPFPASDSFLRLLYQDHQQILQAIKNKNPFEAHDAMLMHLHRRNSN